MAATVAPSSIVVEVLNQKNYVPWSTWVKTYLLAEDLWDIVEDTSEPPKPEDAEFKAWRKTNAKALHAIQISCGIDTVFLISHITVAKNAWDTLAAKFLPVLRDQPGHMFLYTTTDSMESSSERKKHLKTKAGQDNNAYNYLQYETLYLAVTHGDWDATEEFLTENPDAITAKIIYAGEIALHRATIAWQVNIVKKLVPLMKEEDLEIKDSNGKTALILATSTGDMEIVKCMVRKNKKIVSIADAYNRMPVVLAFLNGHWDLASYLYSETPLQDLMPENGPNGATLISQCFYAKKFDIAWDLLQQCPRLAIAKDHNEVSPIYALAGVPSAFPSGKRLRFWQQWIYEVIQIQRAPPHGKHDVCINIQNPENSQGNQREIIRSGLWKGLRWNLYQFLGINHIYEIKLFHVRSREFMDCMCDEIEHSDTKQMEDGLVHAAIFRAVEQGIIEFVIRICQGNRKLLRSTNEMGRSIFHYAIECRQEKVYNLIHGINLKNAIVTLTDTSNNNMLHIVAVLPPFARLNPIPGAALQMQRELQWFKEVESIVPYKALLSLNADGITAGELFTRNHKDLMKDGEKWMKQIATSFTVVGALVITIMFSVAFTVPGGNNGDTGVPLLLDKKMFWVFIVSDAISLCSAITSVLMFLGIFTSSYTEDDFLKSLPHKMTIGVFTLIFSIATMMITFCSAVAIIFQGKVVIVIPTIILAIVPIFLIVSMQFPLFSDIFRYTYGVGLFDRNIKQWMESRYFW